MALVGQAATVAQFAGVDAYGLIKMIAEAAETVRRNKRTCLQLARRAKMIGDLLRQLHGAQLMQQPETRNPVEQLEETLRRALLLVRSCQGRGYLYRCFMGARHADELREVQGEISFYLQLFPLVSYVDTTLTWVRLLNKAAAADPSCKETPMVRPYFVPFLFLSPDGWCLVVIQGVYLSAVFTWFTYLSFLDYSVQWLEAQSPAPLDQSKESSMLCSHDAILQVYKVPGSETQSPAPLHRPKETSMLCSHDAILQFSQETVPLGVAQERNGGERELHSSNKAQVQFIETRN